MQAQIELITYLFTFLYIISIAWIIILLIGFIRRIEKQEYIDQDDLRRTIINLGIMTLLSGFFVGVISIVGSKPFDQDLGRSIIGVLPCIIGNLLIIGFGFLILLIRIYSKYGKN